MLFNFILLLSRENGEFALSSESEEESEDESPAAAPGGTTATTTVTAAPSATKAKHDLMMKSEVS